MSRDKPHRTIDPTATWQLGRRRGILECGALWLGNVEIVQQLLDARPMSVCGKRANLIKDYCTLACGARLA